MNEEELSVLEVISNVNSAVNNFVWGPVVLAMLLGIGIYMSIRLNFFQFRKAKEILNNTVFAFAKGGDKAQESKNVSSFGAMAAAVASTVGVGSIAGVSTAIVTGGPGAVFWMWISALCGMMTKYSEVLLAVYFRRTDENGIHYGGPMYYLEDGVHCKPLAIFFSICAGLCCFVTGNMTQTNSISVSLHDAVGFPVWITGLVVAILAAMVIFGGVKRIASVAEKLVPIMAIFYIVGALIVVAINIKYVPGVFGSIFKGAFNMRSAGGGIMGYGIMLAMRYGVARGLLSNEAGLGSAPMLHATADVDNPVKQAMWGIFEVFITTIAICTMTSLVVLASGAIDSGLKGASLAAKAFSMTYGWFGGVFVALAIAFFAFSSLIGWCYYGECAWGYIFKKHKKLVATIVRLVWIPAAFIGSITEIDLVWSLTDTFNGLMIIPNVIALIALSGVVIKITKLYEQDHNATNMDVIKENLKNFKD